MAPQGVVNIGTRSFAGVGTTAISGHRNSLGVDRHRRDVLPRRRRGEGSSRGPAMVSKEYFPRAGGRGRGLGASANSARGRFVIWISAARLLGGNALVLESGGSRKSCCGRKNIPYVLGRIWG